MEHKSILIKFIKIYRHIIRAYDAFVTTKPDANGTQKNIGRRIWCSASVLDLTPYTRDAEVAGRVRQYSSISLTRCFEEIWIALNIEIYPAFPKTFQ